MIVLSMFHVGVGKPGCSRRSHKPEIAGSNPAPATKFHSVASSEPGGMAPAGARRAMIGGSRLSRAASASCSQSLRDQLEAKLVDCDACSLSHADDVGHILWRFVVKACFRVINARVGLVQKSGDIGTLAKQFAQHHFHGQKPTGKLAAIVDRCVIHGGLKPLLAFRNLTFSSSGPS